MGISEVQLARQLAQLQAQINALSPGIPGPAGPQGDPGGAELDHKELTSTFAVTGQGAANMQDVSGMSALSFVMPNRPVLLEVIAPSVTVATQGSMTLTLRKTSDNAVVSQTATTALTTGSQIVSRKRITTADFPAGSTVSLKLSVHVAVAAGSGNLFGTILSPLSIRAAVC